MDQPPKYSTEVQSQLHHIVRHILIPIKLVTQTIFKYALEGC